MKNTHHQKRIKETLSLLKKLGLPKEQQNQRSAFVLLALLNMVSDKSWDQAENPKLGVTPIMDWIRDYYNVDYAPNTRETIRRQTIHQLLQAGIVNINPDDENRPINSPYTVYQINPDTLKLIMDFNLPGWNAKLKLYLDNRQTLVEQYASKRKQRKIPLSFEKDEIRHISPGEHSELIREIIEEFGPRFAPGSKVAYIGDTGDKNAYLNQQVFESLDIKLDTRGKMPDVILYLEEKKWFLLIEAVSSHGPVNAKRLNELRALFGDSNVKLVFVTAFHTRAVMSRFLKDIAWETEVWVAEAPSHLIHFNGERFLGPY